MDARQREIIRALAQLAWADGEVTPEETELISQFADKLGLSLIDKISQLDSGLAAPDDAPVDLEAVLPDYQSRKDAMQMLVTLCFAGGQVKDSEMKYLGEIAVKLEISAQDLEEMRQNAVKA